MNMSRMSSKHQVVIPKEMREALGIRAGDKIFFVSRNNVVYLLPKTRTLTSALKGLAGKKLKYPKNYLKKERSSW